MDSDLAWGGLSTSSTLPPPLSWDRGQAPLAARVRVKLSDIAHAKVLDSPVKLGRLTFLVAGR